MEPDANPIAQLVAFHRLLDQQLVRLEQVARSDDPAAGCREAAERALPFLLGGAAMHDRLEDSELFPLLRVKAAERGRADIAAVIGVLEREHAVMETHRERLAGVLRECATRGGALDAQELERFSSLCRQHVNTEESSVLPFAREVLGEDELRKLSEHSVDSAAGKP